MTDSPAKNSLVVYLRNYMDILPLQCKQVDDSKIAFIDLARDFSTNMFS